MRQDCTPQAGFLLDRGRYPFLSANLTRRPLHVVYAESTDCDHKIQSVDSHSIWQAVAPFCSKKLVSVLVVQSEIRHTDSGVTNE